MIYKPFQSKCGCISYGCQNYEKCHKYGPNSTFEPQEYQEIFYIDNDYLGKLKYKFITKDYIHSYLTIHSKNMNVFYKEELSTLGKVSYKLYKNSTPIIFQNIPKELINSIKEKMIVKSN